MSKLSGPLPIFPSQREGFKGLFQEEVEVEFVRAEMDFTHVASCLFQHIDNYVSK